MAQLRSLPWRMKCCWVRQQQADEWWLNAMKQAAADPKLDILASSKRQLQKVLSISSCIVPEGMAVGVGQPEVLPEDPIVFTVRTFANPWCGWQSFQMKTWFQF